jgi:hypothetical protein
MSKTSPLIGTWRLRSYETWSPEGHASEPLGAAPIGYAVFDDTGHAFVQLARSPGTAGLDSDAAREVLAGSFLAYFGSYAVKAEGSKLTITVEASNKASYVGSAQERVAEVVGDTLTLGQPGQYRATLTRQR